MSGECVQAERRPFTTCVRKLRRVQSSECGPRWWPSLPSWAS